MSSINSGPSITKTGLVFALDASLSTGYNKTPLQISNCVAWYDASDTYSIIDSSNTVNSWGDKSGTGNTLDNRNYVGPLTNSYTINGLNALYFDGSASYIYMSSSMAGMSSNSTAFCVFVNIDNTFKSFNLMNNDNVEDYFHYIGDGRMYDGLFISPRNGGTIDTSAYINVGNPVLYSTTLSSGTKSYYINGKSIGTSTGTYNLGKRFLVGAGFNLANAPFNYFKGLIGEIIIYSRSLSDTERRQIEIYLSKKWRIPHLQSGTTNRELLTNRTMTSTNNNVPFIDKSYRLDPNDTTTSPKTSLFYLTNGLTYLTGNITTTVTMEAWVKPNSFIYFGSNTDRGGVILNAGGIYLTIDTNGKFCAFMYGSLGSTSSHQPSSASVVRHKWNHIVWTFDGSYIRWYLNGQLDSTSGSTFTIGTITIASGTGIGAEGSGVYGRMLDGYISGCKLYNRALTLSEIKNNYNQDATEYDSIPTIPVSGLSLYYDTDVYTSYSSSAGFATDLTGNSYSGSLVNGVALRLPLPKCYSFDGTDDYIQVSPAFSFNPSTTDFTVSCWAMVLTVKDNATLIDLQASGAGSLDLYTTSSGYANFRSRPSGGATTTLVSTTSSVITASTWVHLTFVKSTSNTTGYLYVNGVLNNSNNFSNNNALPSSTGTMYLGYYADAAIYNNCRIANVMVYTQLLSSSDVLQLYNTHKYRFGK